MPVWLCVHAYVEGLQMCFFIYQSSENTFVTTAEPWDSICVQALDLPAQMSRHTISQQCMSNIRIVQSHACYNTIVLFREAQNVQHI